MWLEIFNFLHFVGLAFGLGGATIATLVSVKSEKDKDVGKASIKIMPAISKLIFMGLILLVISGVALPFFIKWPLNKELLIVKHVLVVWIFIIGIMIGAKSKKMFKLAPKNKENSPLAFLRIRKQMKFLSTINLILWYVVTLMSAFV